MEEIKDKKHRFMAKVNTSGTSKLKEDDVSKIRRLFAAGKHSMKDLADFYSVRRGTINSVISRKTWKHLP